MPWSSLSGRIANEDGEAIRGLTVFVLRPVLYNGATHWQEAGTGVTDHAGMYRIDKLRTGRYRIRTSEELLGVSDFGAPQTEVRGRIYSPAYFPGVSLPEEAAVAKLGEGEDRGGLDFMLTSAPAYSFSGRLALPHPPLTLVLMHASSGLRAKLIYVPSTAATFTMRGVAPGSYTFQAEPEEVATFSCSGAVEIRDVDIRDFEAPCAKAPVVKGRVRVEGPEPFTEYQKLSLGLSGPGISMVPERLVEADGTFHFPNITLRRAIFEVLGIPASFYLKEITQAGREMPERGFDLAVDGTYEIVLSPGAAVVSGSVTGAKRAFVLAIPAGRGGSPIIEQTDSDGEFILSNLPPSEHLFLATQDSGIAAFLEPGRASSLQAVATRIKLTSGKQTMEPLRVVVLP